MYTTDHIFPVVPIKDLINEDGEPTTPFKIATGMKPLVSHLRVLFFPCVVRKSATHNDKKVLNMRHQAQKVFRSILVGIQQHKKVYLVYVPSTKNIHMMLFLMKFFYYVSIYVKTLCRSDCYASGYLIYTLCYILKGTNCWYNHVRTVWRGGLSSETRDDAESVDESNENSVMPPLIIEEEMNAMDCSDESEDEHMSIEML